jgi:hypothetical protein
MQNVQGSLPKATLPSTMILSKQHDRFRATSPSSFGRMASFLFWGKPQNGGAICILPVRLLLFPLFVLEVIDPPRDGQHTTEQCCDGSEYIQQPWRDVRILKDGIFEPVLSPVGGDYDSLMPGLFGKDDKIKIFSLYV